MGGAGRFFQNRIKKTKNSLNVSTACLFKKIDVQYASIRCIAGFQTPFFPINLSPDCAYEAPRRGLLLWPVLHSVQSSPTPSSSTSRSLTPIGSESISSQYQDILSLLLKTEVQDKQQKKNQRKRRENHNSFRRDSYVLTEVVAGTGNKTFHHCLQKRFISVKTRI